MAEPIAISGYFPFGWLAAAVYLRASQTAAMPFRKLTYTGLLTESVYNTSAIDQQAVTQMLQRAQSIPTGILPCKGFFHVIDYTQRKHVALSGPVTSLFGFRPETVLDNGLGFVIDIFQKDDFDVYNQQIFPQIVQQLQAAPPQERNDLLFSFTYRLRRTDGNYNTVYQQGNYVTDPATGLPLYSIALVQDVTPLKKDGGMLFSIDQRTKTGFGYQNLVQTVYQPNGFEARLSRREKEVLFYLAEGLSSKQIAGKLYLSEHTVVIHRKNMLRKTGCKNIAELIRYAAVRGFI